MAAPTVEVTIDLSTMTGEACASTLVTAKLDQNDQYSGGFVIADPVTGTTDEDGVVVLELFPNNPTTGLGTVGSTYTFSAKPAGGKAWKATAQIPNSACDLVDVVDAAIVSGITAAEVAEDNAQGYAAAASASANAADASADAAAASAGEAATAVAGHTADASGAHAATAISVSAIDGMVSTDVQGALEEIATTVAGLALDAEATNLAYTASPTGGTVTSSTGNDASLTLADGTNAGLMAPAQHTALSTATSSITSLSTATSSGLSAASSGLTSLSTAASSGLSTAASGLTSLSTASSSGLSSAASGLTSLSTTASSGLSTAASGLTSLSTATSSALSTGVSGIASVSTSVTSLSTATSSSVASLSTAVAGATPGGADTQVQFNDAGPFGGTADLTFDKTAKTLYSVNMMMPQADNGNGDGTGGVFFGSVATNRAAIVGFNNSMYHRVDGAVAALVARSFSTGSGAMVLQLRGQDGVLGWSFNNAPNGSPSEALGSNAVGVLEVNNGASVNSGGALRDLALRRLIVSPLTVADLPAASTALQGARGTVTDASATTYRSTVAGGGANIVPVFCDGTNWLIS